MVSDFHTCYSEAERGCVTSGSKQRVKTDNHRANFICGRIDGRRSIIDMPVVNHTNAELLMLENMVGRVSPLG
jgi:hypothetical protein